MDTRSDGDDASGTFTAKAAAGAVKDFQNGEHVAKVQACALDLNFNFARPWRPAGAGAPIEFFKDAGRRPMQSEILPSLNGIFLPPGRLPRMRVLGSHRLEPGDEASLFAKGHPLFTAVILRQLVAERGSGGEVFARFKIKINEEAG